MGIYKPVNKNGITILSFDHEDKLDKVDSKTDWTRQSEMANTSPRHMPVLGNVHPIKIENFDIFAWGHFSARSSFLYY